MELEYGGKGAAKGNGKEMKQIKACCGDMKILFHVPEKRSKNKKQKTYASGLCRSLRRVVQLILDMGHVPHPC